MEVLGNRKCQGPKVTRETGWGGDVVGEWDRYSQGDRDLEAGGKSRVEESDRERKSTETEGGKRLRRREEEVLSGTRRRGGRQNQGVDPRQPTNW